MAKSNRQCAVGKIWSVQRKSLKQIKRVMFLFCIVSAVSACTQKLSETRLHLKKSNVEHQGINDQKKFDQRHRELHQVTGNKEFFKLAVGLIF